MPLRASAYATKWLQSRQVELILDERVEDWNALSPNNLAVCLRTDQGRVVEGDLLYKTIGAPPCSELINSPPHDQGGVQPIHVSPTLQVSLDGSINDSSAIV